MKETQTFIIIIVYVNFFKVKRLGRGDMMSYLCDLNHGFYIRWQLRNKEQNQLFDLFKAFD